jgi:curved DNA-binding protein CbpA
MTTPPKPDLYTILGVTTAASSYDLDHAFRVLVRRHHPDTRQQSESGTDADRRLHQILTAYATLRDPTRRAAYDRRRTAPPAAPGASVLEPRLRDMSIPPAIRVGPVRWTPLPSLAADGSAAASVPSRSDGGSHRTR